MIQPIFALHCSRVFAAGFYTVFFPGFSGFLMVLCHHIMAQYSTFIICLGLHVGQDPDKALVVKPYGLGYTELSAVSP